MTTEHPDPQSPEPDPVPDPGTESRTESAAAAAERRARVTRNNKRQGWLYIAIGVALGVLAVIGLVGDDRGILDWLLLALALINLGVGTMALLRPDPRLDDPTGP